MRTLGLTDIKPQPAEFHIASVERSFRIRPFNLDDELWITRKFGDRLQEIMTRGLMREVCEIVFHQMDPEDQAFFEKREVTFVTEDGTKTTVSIGGVNLLQKCIQGAEEKIQIFKALMETIGISRGTQEELEKAATEDQAEKKRPTGLTSSTDSQMSTDGQAITSGR